MPPKRRAALQNQYVNATVPKRSRINQMPASTATSASRAETTIPVSSSPEVTMASSQLQGLIREAFEAGMQEARAHIHPPAQPIDVPVPDASAVQTAATPTTVELTTTQPSTQFTATTVTANMSSAPSTTMAIGEGIFPANSLAFQDDVETDTDSSRHFVSQSLPLHLMVSDIVR
ncbi:uncharacterized protein [Argopecten irradians]|uniref:uncharacterized protein n=1 Tax=Argopecten irradians TaxID=31199 RepID=UPI00371AC6AE